MSSLNNHLYRFGDFTIDESQRVLLRETKPVAITPKVFDTLLILVENRGRIVEKDELMKRLWPDTFVEEANITFNIQQLRKSLSDNARDPRYIETVARRGYRFIADVDSLIAESVPPAHVLPTQNGNGSAMHVEPAPAVPVATQSRSAFFTIAGVVLIVLFGIALFAWQLRAGAGRSFLDASRAGTNALPRAPLKVERLTVTGQSRHVAISPDGKYVAYTRQLENESSVWLRQLTTNTNVEIVPATGVIYGLAFANSGESLYFVRGEPTVLYRVSLLGGVETKIAERLEGNIAISSDDSRIAFVRREVNRDGQQQYSLLTANADGSNEHAILVTTYPNRLDVPLWSADDSSVICTQGYSEAGGQDVSLISVRLADGAKRELTSEKFFRIAKMAWLPNKTAILMTARKNLGDNNQLWRLSYPEMESSVLTNDLSPYLDVSVALSTGRTVASQATRLSDIWVGSSADPKSLKKITQAIDELCWTPDGHIVYTSTASGNRDVWIMRPDGSDQRQLTTNTSVNGGPQVTPDGRYIVFTSNRTGVLQIWRMGLDGANQTQLTDGAAATCPGISHDSKWVYFNTTDDWHLWKISIDGGEPAQVTTYVASGPSISPDGKAIACIGRDQTKREILILPTEGGEPTRKIEIPGDNLYRSRIEWSLDGKAVTYQGRFGVRTKLIRYSLDSGKSEEAYSAEPDEVFDFRYSHDRKFLALTRGGWNHDIVLTSELNR